MTSCGSACYNSSIATSCCIAATGTVGTVSNGMCIGDDICTRVFNVTTTVTASVVGKPRAGMPPS